MIFLPYLKGAMKLDRDKNMPVHVSPCTSYDLNTLIRSDGEVVALIRCVCF